MSSKIVIRAVGPWVLLRRLEPEHQWWTLAGLADGQYHADGTGAQRVAHGRALVVSVGRGYVDQDGQVVEPDPMLKPGVVAVYRGYLEKANQPYPFDDPDLFFVHMKSFEGVFEEEPPVFSSDDDFTSESVGEEDVDDLSVGLTDGDGKSGGILIVGPTVSAKHAVASDARGSALISEIGRKFGHKLDR